MQHRRRRFLLVSTATNTTNSSSWFTTSSTAPRHSTPSSGSAAAGVLTAGLSLGPYTRNDAARWASNYNRKLNYIKFHNWIVAYCWFYWQTRDIIEQLKAVVREYVEIFSSSRKPAEIVTSQMPSCSLFWCIFAAKCLNRVDSVIVLKPMVIKLNLAACRRRYVSLLKAQRCYVYNGNTLRGGQKYL